MINEQQLEISLPSSFFQAIETNQPLTTLETLFNQGMDINQTNDKKQTPLHVAASQNNIEVTQWLLEKGADIDALDRDQKTALHQAAMHEANDCLTLLLSNNANSLAKSNTGETLLHYAAQYGQLKNLATLLEHTVAKTILEVKDDDGKTPLHYAGFHPDYHVALLLIQHGANVNTLTNYNYSPLHFAARSGHRATAQVLVDYGAELKQKNINNETPSELAFASQQTQLSKDLNPDALPYSLTSDFTQSSEFQKLLHTAKQAANINKINEAINAYRDAYRLAEKNKDTYGEIIVLKHLTTLFIAQHDYQNAAKLANSALALFDNNPRQYDLLDKNPETTFLQTLSIQQERKMFISQLAEIERLCIKELQGKKPKLKDNDKTEKAIQKVTQHRQTLISLRQYLKQQIKDDSKPIAELLAYNTETFRKLIEILVKDCIDVLGKPPCDYALMCMGSMSRNEMSPYSDLEFGILIEKEKDKAVTYFKKLTQLLALKITNLGETPCKIGKLLFQPSLPKSGFCMDDGISPLSETLSLIGTPEQFASLQNPDYYDNNERIVPNASKCVGYITGNPELINAYEKQRNAILNESFNQRPLREEQALQMLSGELCWYEPELNQKKEKQRFFNVKEELYRLPNSILNDLAVYYGLKSHSTFERLEELHQRALITQEAKNNLHQAMEYILRLRMKTHLHYSRENEDIYHQSLIQDPLLSQELIQNAFAIEDKDIQILFEIYKVLLPFHKIAKQFCDCAGKNNPLQNAKIYDDDLLTQAEAYERLLQYENAKNCVQQAVAIAPDNQKLLNNLGQKLAILGQLSEAKIYFQRALDFCEKDHDAMDADVAHNLHYVGMTWFSFGDYQKAINYYDRALSIWQKVYSEEHLNIAMSHNNLGEAWRLLSNFEKAFYHYEIALKILEKLGKNSKNISPYVARTFNNLGVTSKSLGNMQNALQYFQYAYDILEKIYGIEHPDVAMVMNNLGDAWVNLDACKKGIECYEQAISIQEKIYHKEHPDVALSLNGLGLAWHLSGDAKKAIAYFECALAIWQKIYGNEHPQIATALMNLGMAWRDEKEFEKAIHHCERALTINRNAYNAEHPQVAQSLHNLGMMWEAYEQPAKAIEFLQQALAIWKKVYGDMHPDVSTCLTNLGRIWSHLNEKQKAIECFEDALKITGKTSGAIKPSIVIAPLMQLAQELFNAGRFLNAIHYYDQALILQKQIHGEDGHADIATCLNNLGGAWNSLGKTQKAIEYFEQSLIISKKIYGTEHAEVAKTLNNLGLAWYILSEPIKTIEYMEAALTIFEKTSGKEHPNIAIGHNILAGAWELLEEMDKAIESYLQALTIRQKVYGNDHPLVAAILNNLASAWDTLQKHEKARELYEQALAIFIKNHGENHLDNATILYNIGDSYETSGNLKKAVEYYERALAIKEKSYGSEHPELEALSVKIAKIHDFLGNYETALNFYKKAYVIFTYHVDMNKDVETFAFYSNTLGYIHYRVKKYEAAIACHKQAITVLQTLYPTHDHPFIAESFIGLGKCFNSLAKHDEAQEMAGKAISILIAEDENEEENNDYGRIAQAIQVLGIAHHGLHDYEKATKLFQQALLNLQEMEEIDHSLLTSIYQNAGETCQAQGNFEYALKYFNEALDIRQKLFSNEHPETQITEKSLLACQTLSQQKLNNNEQVSSSIVETISSSEAITASVTLPPSSIQTTTKGVEQVAVQQPAANIDKKDAKQKLSSYPHATLFKKSYPHQSLLQQFIATINQHRLLSESFVATLDTNKIFIRMISDNNNVNTAQAALKTLRQALLSIMEIFKIKSVTVVKDTLTIQASSAKQIEEIKDFLCRAGFNEAFSEKLNDNNFQP